jgi:hypothetical protein
MATRVMVGMLDRPWSDNNFTFFYVVALAMAGGVGGLCETHLVQYQEMYLSSTGFIGAGRGRDENILRCEMKEVYYFEIGYFGAYG